MPTEATRAAYSARATEYIDLLGSMDSVHPSDLEIVSTWASDVDGDVIDAGCGPGHWTDFLWQQGLTARGIDQVPAFIAHAANAFPTVDFALEGLDSINAGTNSLGGVLAWYSLIHYEPGVIQVPLREFSRQDTHCVHRNHHMARRAADNDLPRSAYREDIVQEDRHHERRPATACDHSTTASTHRTAKSSSSGRIHRSRTHFMQAWLSRVARFLPPTSRIELGCEFSSGEPARYTASTNRPL